MTRRLALLITATVGLACAKRQPPPRSPAAVAAPEPAPPAPPEACYSHDDAATRAAGDVETTDDPRQSVFVLDREMLPELGRRLDHPSGAQKHSSLDKAIIEMVARRHFDGVKACYDALLATAPGKTGTVTTRFAIGADGQVTHTRVTSSTLNDGETEDCIGRSLCGWRFPALAAGKALVVDYPFLLSSPP